MNELAMQMKHPKLRGEWAELRFMTCAFERGFVVTKPWGDTAQYDFGVEYQAHTLRVQVKSTLHERQGRYTCTLRGRVGYADGAFDFLAAYVVPQDIWYIIPGELVFGHTSIQLLPHKHEHRFGLYKEAWDLMKNVDSASTTSAPGGSANTPPSEPPPSSR